MLPSKIGRYEIVEELGRGAMGVVYRGFDPTIGRPVAIKTILLDSGDPEVIKRFRREAQAAGILSFPNIVTIYDAGEDNGVFYIAMELVEGETLREVLTQGALPVDRVISIMEQVGAALDHAHSRQIVHRDIKPANIILAQGRVKVTDFGVAKITTSHMTSTGQIVGTPSYISPELLQGTPADGRADIFSAGVLLYEMLTGSTPFTGETLSTVMYKILMHDPPAPSVVNPSLHAGLDSVVLKALAKNPADRYQNCAEFLTDLRNHQALADRPAAVGQVALPTPAAGTSSSDRTVLLDRKEPKVAPPKPMVPVGMATPFPQRKLWLAAMAAVVVAVAVGLVWQYRRAPTLPSNPAQPVVRPAPTPAAPTLPAPTPPTPAPSATEKQAGPSEAKRPQRQPLPGPKTVTSQTPSPRATPPPRQTPSEIPRQTPRAPTAPGPSGRVVILTEPQGARILVDGKPTPYRSPVNFALPAGTHQITVERGGFADETREVVVRSNKTSQVRLELVPSGERRRLLPFR